jgi:hypothetical protein
MAQAQGLHYKVPGPAERGQYHEDPEGARRDQDPNEEDD